MNVRDTLRVNEKGHVEIGGFDTMDIKERFGTPLYVLDLNYVKSIIATFVQTFKEVGIEGKVLYASKALSTTALYTFIENYTEAGVDVVSGGELYTALLGGTTADKIYFHGNNKQDYEILFAIKSGVHAIVIDNFDEIEIVNKFAKKYNKKQNVLLRVNPGISAHTHEFVQTATEDSKFGLSISNGTALQAIEEIKDCENLELLGIHTHIGSQIFEHDSFVKAAVIMTDFLKTVKDIFNFELKELNMGGGFGIYYEGEDKVFNLSTYADHLRALLVAIASECSHKGLKVPYVCVEPGRAIVGEAGITLYTVGSIKDINNVRKYVSIDGGMFDNPRYALYQSRYSGCLANKASLPKDDLVTIAGKCCESGDMIGRDIMIQKPVRGDTLCVFSTGAYNYSMASNYNRNMIPPVVGVFEDNAEYLVKPQSFEDLTRNDVVPNFMKKK